MSKQVKSYAEKHKFGFLDKSKKTKKTSKPKTKLNTLTLRDLCFFIYGIKGLQLFETLQALGINECSFEFWNSIRDGILLETSTKLDNLEPLPEFEFDFINGGLL